MTREPGISDAERLEELRYRMRYAMDERLAKAERLGEAQRAYTAAINKEETARKAYVEWLEMMAAGVASK